MLTIPQWQRAVREQLKRTGLTQGDAALVLGVGRSTVERWLASPGCSNHQPPGELKREGVLARLVAMAPP